MNARERALAAGAVVVALLAVAVLAVPGALVGPPEPTERPSALDVRELTVARGEAAAGTATLQVNAVLAHRGSPAENVTLLVRATDEDSGLVAAKRRVAVGTIAAAETTVSANVTVPREGGYRLDVVVYRNQTRVATGHTTVRGVGALAPVRFHEFSNDFPVIEYRIARAGETTATLNVSTYLTNVDDDPARGLRLVLKARQSGSNIVADTAVVPIGAIPPGHTVTPNARLTVPDDYDYYLDAELWHDGVLVDTARSVADLNPSESLTANVTQREEELRVGDFTQGREKERTPATPHTDAGGQPGFGVGAALAAFLATALLTAHRARRD